MFAALYNAPMDNKENIFPAEFMSLTAEYHFKKYNSETNIIYKMMLCFVVLALISVFFVKVNINVKSAGSIKSTTEHNEIKTLVSASVDSLYIAENQHVTKGQVLVKLKAAAINQQDIAAHSQQAEFDAQEADLEQLVALAKA